MQAKKITEIELKNSDAGKKYYKVKTKVVRYNENCEAWIDNNGYLAATSFQWWKIICEKNGLYFFNWYTYSSFTSKHQSKISRLVRELGIDYITVKYCDNLGGQSAYSILCDKINELYTRENDLQLSKARKYAVYSENEFNQLLSDIKTIATACKISNKELDKMLLDAELKATEKMLNKLCDKLELDNTRKELAVKIESLEAIAV